MEDLVAWLRAQLDADAGLANGLGYWADYVESTKLDDSAPEAAYMRRVLREVVAKREILEWHDAAWKNKRFHPDDLAGKGWLLAMVKVVKLIALPYADRPGYQDSWRP